MEQNSNIENNDLNIHVKAKKCPRYKAGPELGKIQSIEVEVNEDYSGECDMLELNILFKKKKLMINADA